MINIKVSSNFDADGMEKKVVQLAVKKIKSDLSKAGVSGVTVTPTKKGKEWVFRLSGPDDQVKKANEVLQKK